MAKTPSRQEITSIIPFYADPEISVKQFAALSTSALRTIAHIGLHHQVILVDDGLTLRGNVDIEHIVTTLTVKSRLGKAGAVRKGLALALRQNPKAQFFIQSDFDGDPDPRQVTSMIRHIVKAGFSGNKPAMILGERDMAMAKAGHLSTHRQAIFGIQKNSANFWALNGSLIRLPDCEFIRAPWPNYSLNWGKARALVAM